MNSIKLLHTSGIHKYQAIHQVQCQVPNSLSLSPSPFPWRKEGGGGCDGVGPQTSTSSLIWRWWSYPNPPRKITVKQPPVDRDRAHGYWLTHHSRKGNRSWTSLSLVTRMFSMRAWQQMHKKEIPQLPKESSVPITRMKSETRWA